MGRDAGTRMLAYTLVEKTNRRTTVGERTDTTLEDICDVHFGAAFVGYIYII